MDEMDMETKLRTAEWKPIKTAPRDGTKIDLWFPRHGIGYRPNAYWHPVLKGWGWDEDHDGEGYVSTLPNLKPSHWTLPIAKTVSV